MDAPWNLPSQQENIWANEPTFRMNRYERWKNVDSRIGRGWFVAALQWGVVHSAVCREGFYAFPHFNSHKYVTSNRRWKHLQITKFQDQKKESPHLWPQPRCMGACPLWGCMTDYFGSNIWRMVESNAVIFFNGKNIYEILEKSAVALSGPTRDVRILASALLRN